MDKVSRDRNRKGMSEHLSSVKLLSIFAVTVMAIAAMAVVFESSEDANADEIKVETWSDLQDKVNKASTGDVIVLEKDLQADGKDRIYVKNKTITIDLNGHMLDRKLKKSDEDGHVIEVQGDSVLTIKDSVGTGIITGGYAEHGGGIHVGEDAKCIINGGTIYGNKSSIDGGGIYVRGSLVMNGGAVDGNYAEDTAGGIYCADTGTINLNNASVSNNSSKNEGGAMRLHLKNNDSSIIACGITGNESRTDDGGAISIDAKGKTLRIIDTILKNNHADKNGGAIELFEGKLIINGCEITDNIAEGAGGALYNEGCTVEIGMSDKQATTFSDNYTEDSGGAIYACGGTLTITGAVFKGNEAEVSGGAIYADDDIEVTINGGSFTENAAFVDGGAMYFGIAGENIYKIQGDLVVKDNIAGIGNNIYLSRQVTLSCGQLDEKADIYVSVLEVNKVFTSGYQMYNSGKDPTLFFSAEAGHKIELDSNTKEAKIVYDVAQANTEGTFIDWRDQVNTDMDSINSTNWMSGISGERYLTEINIPATHDSAMIRVNSEAGYSVFASFAKTQYRYIDEQLEEGVRWLDCRLNNLKIEEDDGKNLYLCHGKTLAGTYFALDHNGDILSFDTVLSWVKSFLAAHPTETVIIGVSPETEDDDRIDTIFWRLYLVIEQLSKEINPATGEPYLYMQDGDFNQAITKVPQLKDVRGKILIECENRQAQCSVDFGHTDGLKKYSQKGSYKDDAGDKIKNVRNFYHDDSRKNLSILTDASDHRDYYLQAGLNGTDEPFNTPVEIADEVLNTLFTKEELFKRDGIYYGFVKFDGYEYKYGYDIWSSNFFDGLEYCTLTVKSGLSNEPDQVYKLLKGTPLSIPGNIYSYDGDFYGWLANGTVYREGASMLLKEDTVVEAQWDSTEERIDDKSDIGGPVWFAAGAIVVLAAVGAALLIVRFKH